MEVCRAVAGLSEALDRARAEGRTVGLVPTMGALHAGHRSLIGRARAECGHVVVTVFVNPLQFGDPEDLRRYPRDLESDLAVCRAEGVSTVFAPPVEEMYPDGPGRVATTVSVGGVSEGWEGASRPGHFDGVATVVTKLFAMAGRCRAYFGEKDFQQLAVVRRLTDDLSLPVEVVACPTVREPDGLALSSRNVRLSEEERRAAAVVPRALAEGVRSAADPGATVALVEARMAEVVAAEPAAALDYAAVVGARDLRPADDLDHPGGLRLLIAVRVGPVRLIDNCALDAGPMVVSAQDGRGFGVASSGAMAQSTRRAGE